ncbi:hypothetical protein ACH42_03325 [Endozoicomonas sp. (ex Bugula neritina AB1)]|nr:hypothetical protein ACH42_03325 [Endozoicomonas sp. (ex Bugula neritina AB1)]
MSQNPRKSVRNKDGSRRVVTSEEDSKNHDAHKGAQRQQAAKLSIQYLRALHVQMGKEAYHRLLKTPFASLMNSLMIAVAFTLPALLYLLVINLQVLGGSWDGQPRVSVYLNEGIKQQAIDSLLKEISATKTFEEVIYVSPEQGLKDFQNKAGVTNIASELGFNPLPGVIQLTAPADVAYQKLNAFVDVFRSKAGVDQVKLDRQWVQRLHAILGLLENVVYTLGVLLSLTVLLVISNTIRLNIESRRDEIRIIKMVGGTDGFITLPFLYMGIWYGLAGAIIAQVVIFIVMILLAGQVSSLSGLYNSGMAMQGSSLAMFSTMLFTGILLGIMGAIVSCYRHLRTLRPV